MRSTLLRTCAAGSILTGLGVFFAIGILVGSKQTSDSDEKFHAALALLLLDGPGIPLLVIGLSSKKKVYERNDLGSSLRAGPLVCRFPEACAGQAIGGSF